MIEGGAGLDAPLPSDSARIELAQVQGFAESASKAEETWRLLMESVKDFAILLIDLDGRIASWNAGAARLLGYGAGEIIGQPISTLYVGADVQRGAPADELRRAAQEGRSTDDNWLVRKDGSHFWASGVTTPLRKRDGTIAGFAKVVRDLTEQKLGEDQLRKVNEQLEERVQARTRELEMRVGELEGFCSSVAHDLRTPLRAIAGYADLLREPSDTGLAERDRETFLGNILEAARSMDTLIQHLLAYSRMSGAKLSLRPVDLGALVGTVIESMQLEVRERGASVEIEGPFYQVLVDAEMARQVISNLVSNALKFVSVGTKPLVRIRAESRGSEVRLWIEDNGIGITLEYQDRIFLPFERLHTSEEYPGTGMGLAIVKKASERMGGAVGVESKPGRGSRFWVEFPPAP